VPARGGRVPRDAVINIRIPRHLKDALRKAAIEDHGRSMSGMLVRILEEWFELDRARSAVVGANKSKIGVRRR